MLLHNNSLFTKVVFLMLWSIIVPQVLAGARLASQSPEILFGGRTKKHGHATSMRSANELKVLQFDGRWL